MQNTLSLETQQSNTVDSVAREKLLVEYYPLVRYTVNAMRSRLPSHADLDELHSVGVSGLMAAVDNYDADQHATFKAYASLRIRGAILDELRKLDSLPRNRRASFREIQKTIADLEQELGRAPKDDEMAKAMGISEAEFVRLQEKTRPTYTVSLDMPTPTGEDDRPMHDMIADDRQQPVFEAMEHRELIDEMADKIQTLPERMQKVLVLYYFEGCRLAEIAEVYGVTEARICQLHTEALRRLRSLIRTAA